MKVTYIVHHAISKVISRVKRYKLLSFPYKEKISHSAAGGADLKQLCNIFATWF